MSTLYLITDGRGSDFCIAEAFSRRSAADSVRGKDRKSTLNTLTFDVDTHESHYTAYIVLGNEGVKKCFTDLTAAKQYVKEFGGSIDRREVLPAPRIPQRVHVYEYWVSLRGEEPEVIYHDSRSIRVAKYEGETTPYLATRRRAYRDCLPYRITVVGFERDRCENLAYHLADKGQEWLEANLEYNVDYPYEQDSIGRWESK